jgi:hypothetical protein
MAQEEGYIIRFRLRCFFGFHKWEEMPRGKYIIQREGWWCRRCGFIAPKCDNCGDRHNPAKITLCIYTKEG